MLNTLCIDFSTTFENAKYRDFSSRTTPAFAFAMATEITLVQLYFACKLRGTLLLFVGDRAAQFMKEADLCIAMYAG